MIDNRYKIEYDSDNMKLSITDTKENNKRITGKRTFISNKFHMEDVGDVDLVKFKDILSNILLYGSNTPNNGKLYFKDTSFYKDNTGSIIVSFSIADSYYIRLQEIYDGWDYTICDKFLNVIDEGQLDDCYGLSVTDALLEFLNENGILKEIDWDDDENIPIISQSKPSTGGTILFYRSYTNGHYENYLIGACIENPHVVYSRLKDKYCISIYSDLLYYEDKEGLVIYAFDNKRYPGLSINNSLDNLIIESDLLNKSERKIGENCGEESDKTN